MDAMQIHDLVDNAPLSANLVANILGYKHDLIPEGGALNEFTKLGCMRIFAGRVVTEIPSEMQQDVIWSEICASYLDRVVQDFFGPPSRSDAPNAQIAEELDVYNAYFEVIKSSQHVPYFSKFLRVSPYAEKLPQAICDRLLVPEVGPKWTTLFSDPYPLSVAAMVVQVLNTILTSYTKKGTPDHLLKKKTKEDILKLLGIWILQAPSNQDGRFLRTVSERTVRGLTSPQFAKTLANQARRELKNWEVCGLPSCGIKDDRILKACSRCGTIRYCCTDHQRQHWRLAGHAHKPLCFQTSY